MGIRLDWFHRSWHDIDSQRHISDWLACARERQLWAYENLPIKQTLYVEI